MNGGHSTCRGTGEKLKARIAELETIVNKLPVDCEGRPLVVGVDTVWVNLASFDEPQEGGMFLLRQPYEEEVNRFGLRTKAKIWWLHRFGINTPLSLCHSTREAALEETMLMPKPKYKYPLFFCKVRRDTYLDRLIVHGYRVRAITTVPDPNGVECRFVADHQPKPDTALYYGVLYTVEDVDLRKGK